MKTVFVLALLSLLCGFASQDATAAAQSSYDLRSPDGRIEVRIRTAGQLHYDLLLKGTAVLENCTLSLDVEHQKLGVDPHVVEAKPSSHDEIVKPVVRQKFASIRDHYNELRLNMEDGYAVVFRAYNEGAAYRFETSLREDKAKIYGEEAAFNFPSDFVVYYPQEDTFYSHNERKYLPQHLSEIAPTVYRDTAGRGGYRRRRETRDRGIRFGRLSRAVVARDRREWPGGDVPAVPLATGANQRSRLQAGADRGLHRSYRGDDELFPGECLASLITMASC